jgi:hypothetical protein
MEFDMKDKSLSENARWKKGQSGNPKGRPRSLPGAGLTLTGLARTMMERPVESGHGRRTRLADYMIDVVARADAGDIKCRIFLLQLIDRGDRRKESAQRNAKKAKSEDVRKFEEAKANEISSPMPPLPPDVEDAYVAHVSPTAPQRATHISGPSKAATHKAPSRESSLASAAMFRRDPATGHLVTPEGRVLSPAEEDQLLYPAWPHISPHLTKTPVSATSAGDLSGRKSSVPDSQAVDSTGNSVSEKISQENPLETPRKGTRH